jgi:curli biogenesis system outer membrane secretion channel CsgG
MKEQIADTLMQTNAFIVQGHQVSSDGGEAQAVEVKEKGKKTIAGGKPEDVEFMLYGTVTAYTPSQASIPAGVEADPLLGVRSKGSGASSAFKILEQRAKESANVDQDRVAMDIQLVYARTKQEIGVTSFECNPQDWGDSLGGIFGNMLLTTSVQPQTPMQKAARACVIKVVNWVADKCLEARANPSLFAAPIEIPPDPKIRRIQKDLNTLGYDCGKEDGKRGVKTEACIAQFLQEARIEEPALEDELQKRLGQKPKEPEPKPKSLPVTPVATTSPPAASKSSPSEQPAGNQRPVATTPPPIAPSVPPVSNPEKEWGE